MSWWACIHTRDGAQKFCNVVYLTSKQCSLSSLNIETYSIHKLCTSTIPTKNEIPHRSYSSHTQNDVITPQTVNDVEAHGPITSVARLHNNVNAHPTDAFKCSLLNARLQFKDLGTSQWHQNWGEFIPLDWLDPKRLIASAGSEVRAVIRTGKR